MPKESADSARAQALSRSELRYRSLIDATSAVTWACPPSGLHVEPQPSWMAFTGQGAEEMLGAGWVKAVHPDDVEAAAARWTKAVAETAPYLNEHRIRRHDGQWRWMRAHAVPIRDDEGRVIEWFGVLVDITDNREADEALRASEARYRTLHESMRDAFVQVDMQGRIVACNALYAAMLGYSGEQLHGMSYLELTPGCWHAMEAAILSEQILVRGYSEVYEKEYRRSDGTVIPVEMRAVLERDEAGAPRSMWAMVRDISQRHQWEEAMSHERERFQRALEAAPTAILIVDRAGQIVLANPALRRLFGFEEEELLGGAVEKLVPVAMREKHALLRDEFMASVQARRMGKRPRLTGRRKDGSEFPIEIGLSSITLGDEALIVAVVADTTVHEEAIARQAQARRAAEAASEAKTRFLANISHELRTPLNAVLGINDLLRLGDLSPRQTVLLNKQQAAGRHLLQVINAILDLAKIESGKDELIRRRFRIEDLVGVVTDMVHEPALAKGLRLSAFVEPGLPEFVGDDTRLQQALLNYVNNAVKFSARGTVGVRVHSLESDATAMLLRFEVQDEGIGIEPDVLPRLFTPFEQADSSSTRRFGGTGLGLSITRRIAEMMGGTAGARSVPGHGSTFWFTARLDKAPRAKTVAEVAEPPAQALRRSHAGRPILLAEDDLVSAEIAQHVLHAAGLQVTHAHDGAEAVALAATRRFDLILMDLTMPGMDGLEAARRIRSDVAQPQGPIVALTANAFSEDRARALAAGMVDLVSKPVDGAALCAAVLKWLEAGQTDR